MSCILLGTRECPQERHSPLVADPQSASRGTTPAAPTNHYLPCNSTRWYHHFQLQGHSSPWGPAGNTAPRGRTTPATQRDMSECWIPSQVVETARFDRQVRECRAARELGPCRTQCTACQCRAGVITLETPIQWTTTSQARPLGAPPTLAARSRIITVMRQDQPTSPRLSHPGGGTNQARKTRVQVGSTNIPGRMGAT